MNNVIKIMMVGVIAIAGCFCLASCGETESEVDSLQIEDVADNNASVVDEKQSEFNLEKAVTATIPDGYTADAFYQPSISGEGNEQIDANASFTKVSEGENGSETTTTISVSVGNGEGESEAKDIYESAKDDNIGTVKNDIGEFYITENREGKTVYSVVAVASHKDKIIYATIVSDTISSDGDTTENVSKEDVDGFKTYIKGLKK